MVRALVHFLIRDFFDHNHIAGPRCAFFGFDFGFGRVGGNAIDESGAALTHETFALCQSADAVLFGAVGTAGQRCTSTRRLFLHEKVHDQIVERLVRAYGSVTIGDPLDPSTLMGPLIDDGAVKDYKEALAQVTEEGGEILCGGSPVDGPGSFVQPTIVKAHRDMNIVREETFAPILYVMRYSDFEDVIEQHGDHMYNSLLRTASQRFRPQRMC